MRPTKLTEGHKVKDDLMVPFGAAIKGVSRNMTRRYLSVEAGGLDLDVSTHEYESNLFSATWYSEASLRLSPSLVERQPGQM